MKKYEAIAISGDMGPNGMGDHATIIKIEPEDLPIWRAFNRANKHQVAAATRFVCGPTSGKQHDLDHKIFRHSYAAFLDCHLAMVERFGADSWSKWDARTFWVVRRVKAELKAL
tara:strand:- start:828 stop:1169 length:342 start_codon:yes stop_codon:yes gene_type:complete